MFGGSGAANPMPIAMKEINPKNSFMQTKLESASAGMRVFVPLKCFRKCSEAAFSKIRLWRPNSNSTPGEFLPCLNRSRDKGI